MKKTLKKPIAILAVLVLCVIILCTMSGCTYAVFFFLMGVSYLTDDPDKSTPKECGDFVYYENEDRVYIVDLTTQGKTKTVLSIPDTIYGNPVCGFYYKHRVYLPSRGYELDLYGSICKKLYVNYNLINSTGLRFAGERINRCKRSDYDDYTIRYRKISESNSPVERYVYPDFIKIDKDTAPDNANVHANMSFYVNNELYWIDYIEEGEEYILPDNPELYPLSFAGWYTDREYTSKWDNAYDLHGEKALNLYAKFT